jgi:hypothetical protein
MRGFQGWQWWYYETSKQSSWLDGEGRDLTGHGVVNDGAAR